MGHQPLGLNYREKKSQRSRCELNAAQALGIQVDRLPVIPEECCGKISAARNSNLDAHDAFLLYEKTVREINETQAKIDRKLRSINQRNTDTILETDICIALRLLLAISRKKPVDNRVAMTDLVKGLAKISLKEPSLKDLNDKLQDQNNLAIYYFEKHGKFKRDTRRLVAQYNASSLCPRNLLSRLLGADDLRNQNRPSR